MPGHITLVTEDLPSEAIAGRLVAYVDPDVVVTTLGRQGVGYIRAKLRNLNHAASGMRIVAIVDRDSIQNCPIKMVATWLGDAPKNRNLVVRMAEMEIESWIMADREGIASFLNVPLTRIPQFPDTLPDPKQKLVNIARLSRTRSTRDQMCPPPGARTLVGPAYNSLVENFVRTLWNPAHAMQNSPSLRRAVQRIRELALRAI